MKIYNTLPDFLKELVRHKLPRYVCPYTGYSTNKLIILFLKLFRLTVFFFNLYFVIWFSWVWDYK